MKKIATMLTAASLLLATFAVGAAPTTNLEVKGKIRPPACMPVVGGGGIVDYGVIPASSLQAGQYKRLGARSAPFTVTCDAPMRIAVGISDGRRSSALPAAIPEITQTDAIFGLGLVAEKKVGAYTVAFDEGKMRGDGAAVTQLWSEDGNKTWTKTGAMGRVMMPSRTFSWSSDGVAPSAFKVISGEVQVVVRLNMPEELPLTQEIPLDGVATLEIQYL